MKDVEKNMKINHLEKKMRKNDLIASPVLERRGFLEKNYEL
jgi:hypothetical protein